MDEKLINEVTITDYQNEKLPEEITQNIQMFSQILGDTIQVDLSFAQHSLDEMGDGENDSYLAGDLQTVAQNATIQNAVSLFKSWIDLQTRKIESRITVEKYDMELSKLQEQFRKDMQAIDDKSAVLRKALKQINVSQSDRQLREGLLALADIQDNLTDKGWDDFFNGTKTIEI